MSSVTDQALKKKKKKKLSDSTSTSGKSKKKSSSSWLRSAAPIDNVVSREFEHFANNTAETAFLTLRESDDSRGVFSYVLFSFCRVNYASVLQTDEINNDCHAVRDWLRGDIEPKML